MPGSRKVDASSAAKSIKFVDENDGRRLLASLLKEVAHASRADADKHLDKLGTRNGKKRHAGFAGNSPREKGLSRTGWTDQ